MLNRVVFRCLKTVVQSREGGQFSWCGESSTPRLNDTGVADSPYHRYGESAIEFFKKKTLCIDDTESRQLPAPVILWVADSPYPWVGESPTPRIVESGSRRLRVSVIRGVAVRKKNLFSFDFQYFKRLKHAFKGSIWPKISQGCIVLSQ